MCDNGSEVPGDCRIRNASDMDFPFESQCEPFAFSVSPSTQLEIGIKQAGQFVDFYINSKRFGRLALPFGGMGECDNKKPRIGIDRISIAPGDVNVALLGGIKVCSPK